MKVFIVDIATKVPRYDIALAEALSRYEDGSMQVYVFAPNIEGKNKSFHAVKLLGAADLDSNTRLHPVLLLLKTIKTFINYLILGWHIWKQRPEILHIEWLPMLDYVGVERYIVLLLRRLAPNMRVIYTIHNVYPHNMSPAKKEDYKKRFLKLTSLIDGFVVHTASTKDEVICQYGIVPDKIVVIPHGIFKIDYAEGLKRGSNDKVGIIMYGNQTYYKGTDILIEATDLLPNKYKNMIRMTIAGRIDDDYMKKLQVIQTGVETRWMPYYVDDQELSREIMDSDIIILPYRAISQSGVLLLALSFGKIIFTSDLPSFKETLEGYDNEMFFESENPQSLANLLKRYLDRKIDIDRALLTIRKLNDKYSWNNVAALTCSLYKSIVGNYDKYKE